MYTPFIPLSNFICYVKPAAKNVMKNCVLTQWVFWRKFLPVTPICLWQKHKTMTRTAYPKHSMAVTQEIEWKTTWNLQKEIRRPHNELKFIPRQGKSSKSSTPTQSSSLPQSPTSPSKTPSSSSAAAAAHWKIVLCSFVLSIYCSWWIVQIILLLWRNLLQRYQELSCIVCTRSFMWGEY